MSSKHWKLIKILYQRKDRGATPCHWRLNQISLEFEPADLWVGAFLKRQEESYMLWFTLFLVIIPTLPLRFSFGKSRLRDDADFTGG